MDVADLDQQALEATGRVVALVRAEHLAAPTPCAGWDVRALLVHMAGNNNGFAEAALDRPADPAVWAGAELAGDPVEEYRKSAEQVAAVFRSAGVLDRDFEVHGFGTYNGRTAIGMHFIDYLVHGWDVAMAIGVDYTPDHQLCRAVLTMGARWPKDSPAIWGPDAPFGYPVPVPDDAPPDHRMLGFLGRAPAWSPD